MTIVSDIVGFYSEDTLQNILTDGKNLPVRA